MKKDDIESLFKHSILQCEQRAQERAMERNKLEQTKLPNDPLYHLFMSMYETTTKMPQAFQHIVKTNVFQIVPKVEADLESYIS
jgi:hypothetical protein